MHREALTEEGAKLWPQLASLGDFYLAGGTAVALQLGHRVSVDFDFFSDKSLSLDLLPSIERLFNEQKQRIMVNNSEELTLLISDTKLTFLKYPFPLLYPTILVERVQLATIAELAAIKAYTIGRRGSFKDYFDLYSILQSGYALTTVIADAEKKYRDNFNSRLFLEQLVDLSDITDSALRFLVPVISPPEVEQFFSGAVKKLKW
ncbi:MAG: nucleotidyl transferase AbiEii/AbiGii toxin family protein [Patescibacteria group bacterium]